MSTIRLSVEDEARVPARQAIVALPAGRGGQVQPAGASHPVAQSSYRVVQLT